ncbi:MAG TPA: hypothetical protein VGS80_23305, partial [Ktedonobacterales bacterium]|nr:hypothetical protein [Ktedonobacterales bacterium]
PSSCLLTPTAILRLVSVGAVIAHTATYTSALVLVAVGSLIAVGAIFSLDIFSPMVLISTMAAVD